MMIFSDSLTREDARKAFADNLTYAQPFIRAFILWVKEWMGGKYVRRC